MKIDWKNATAIATAGAFAGTAIGMALVTLVGNLVDGDEVYVFQSEDGTKTAIIISCRGGLFAHAHPLNKIKSDGNSIKFTIGNALLHSHADETTEYSVVSKGEGENETHTIVSNNKIENISLSGGFHVHQLKVLRVIYTFEELKPHAISFAGRNEGFILSK